MIYAAGFSAPITHLANHQLMLINASSLLWFAMPLCVLLVYHGHTQQKSQYLNRHNQLINADELDDNYIITPIAHDGIALVVNPANPINNITHSQVNNIYHGITKNWQQVGGNNEEIAVVSRENASGSRFSFEHFMQLTQNVAGFTVSDINPEVLVVSTNGMVKSLIARNQQAIGYLSFGSIDSSIKPLSYNGVTPTISNIHSGEYKMARPFLIMYKKQGLSANAAKFIQFLASDDAKKIINNNGYIAESS